MRKALWLAAMGAVNAIGFDARTFAASQYVITDLGTLGGTESAAYSINESGQVVGRAWLNATDYHAYLWTPTAPNGTVGAMCDLNTLGGTNSVGTALNNSGRVAGYASTAVYPATHAFRTAPNAAINLLTDDLGTLGERDSFGHGINDSGTVVGGALVEGAYVHAFRHDGSVMTDLGTFGGSVSRALDINDGGFVAGFSQVSGDTAFHAFRSAPNANINPLTDDLGTLGGTNSFGSGINSIGQVTGESQATAGGANHAFLWTSGASDGVLGNPRMKDLGTLGGTYSQGISVNESGQVVGGAFTSGNAARHAFLYSAGVMNDLNDSIACDLGWEMVSAEGMNNRGQIVGHGTIGGQTHAFLLTPGMVWNVDASEPWTPPINWLGGVPNGVGTAAWFTDKITAARTVTLDFPRTIGAINFHNQNSYTLAGALLTIDDTPCDRAQINVISGSHTISAPLALATNTNVNIAPTSTLTFSGNMTGTGNLTKNGPGKLKAKHIRAGNLSVAEGTLQIIDNSLADGVSKVAALTVSPGAKLDLRDNKIITTSSVPAVTALIATGRNGGTWDAPGITTSMTDATSGSGYTMLGVATASEAVGIGATQTALWCGQTVTGSDTLVMYTYGGDANLDGLVNIDDYGQIDFNSTIGGVLPGWYNGDFDYSGGVPDVDDYGIIDFVFPIQGPPFSTGAAAQIVATTPEPLSMTPILLAASAVLRRSRRN